MKGGGLQLCRISQRMAAVTLVPTMFVGVPGLVRAQVSEQDHAASRYADCLVARHHRKVADALDSGFDAVFEKALARVPTTGCINPATASVSGKALRGQLFAAMYRRFGPQAGRTASNISPSWVPQLAPSDPRAGWYSVSNCLVQREPTATRALVRAKPGSTSASAQMNKVTAKLPLCLPAGAPITVKRSMLADLIAETVYQIDFAVGPGDKKSFGSH